jgi:uncharacterized protein (TIGR01370 family)
LAALLLLLLFLASSASAAPNVAWYYGSDAPLDELKAFDIAVVEPGHGYDPKTYRSQSSELFAYVAVGEVQHSRDYAREMDKAWIIGDNPAWGAQVVDLANPAWQHFFVERIVAPLWQRGYRGFFLDTLDSYQLVAKTENTRRRQEDGLVATITLLKQRFPGAKLIFNRGFEVLPRLHQLAFAVAAESLFGGWDAAGARYVDVPPADRDWLKNQLDRVKNQYGLPVYVIDYAPPGSRERARSIARQIAALGFTPYVTDGGLTMLGVGNVEVMPRKILMMYDSRNGVDVKFDEIHRYATLPINYLGYVPDYRDVREPLSEGTLVGRYAGIVTWINAERLPNGEQLADWLRRQRADGIRIAVLSNFGFALTVQRAAELGLRASEGEAVGNVHIVQSTSPVGFERQPLPDKRTFRRLEVVSGQPLLRLADAAGARYDAVAYTDWGGYALEGYATVSLPEPKSEQSRWIVDPIDFLAHALALPAMPVPDTTSENGRRLMLVHVDGDGFPSIAELPGRPVVGEALLNEVLQKYRVPTTVSVIQGEVAANGLNPKQSPALEAIALRIFALPHVEPASHTFSHPFLWSAAETVDKEDQGYHLDIPGYVFDARVEVAGAASYVSKLSPPDKPCRIVLWSGNTTPGPATLKLAYDSGLLNMNGGETIITRSNPSLTAVAPLGEDKSGYFQVYAPNQNENVYTNNWRGPYYGFERVIETFQLTDSPRRLKPIDIYFHAYSASKRASLAALDKVYRWTQAQPVMNIYASEYIRKVLDFQHLVIARTADGFLVRGAGDLRQLRYPEALGAVDVKSSRNVAGWSQAPEGRYAHLSLGEAEIRFSPSAPSFPYLRDANARLTTWRETANGIEFGLGGYRPLSFSVAAAADCRYTLDGKPLEPRVRQQGVSMFELPSHAAETFQVRCAS